MSVDWRALSEEDGFELDGQAIRVVFGSGRSQKVVVAEDERSDGFTLTSVIASRSLVDRLYREILERIGEQNRLSELVGYRLDRRGRLIGESWCPTAGLTVDEWQFYVRNLAEACDRLEFVLTGADRV
jgi:hypothetical protein